MSPLATYLAMYASAGLNASLNKEPQRSAPEKKAEITKLYLRVRDLECLEFLKAKNLVDIFNEGTVRVIFYDMSTKKYSEYSNKIHLTEYTSTQLKKILGDDNVVAK